MAVAEFKFRLTNKREDILSRSGYVITYNKLHRIMDSAYIYHRQAWGVDLERYAGAFGRQYICECQDISEWTWDDVLAYLVGEKMKCV